MKGFIATVSLSLVGLALSDPLACDGQACMVENDQAAMLQSSLLHKGEASGAIAREGGQFCKEAKDYGCYRKTGLPACCTDGLRKTCGSVTPPCDKKRKKKGKGGSSRRRRRRSSSRSWGREVDHTYCSGSYDGQDSRRAAKSACKRDEACGGIYQPGNEPGKWFLCKGFDTYASTSNSVAIEKLGGSSPSPSPSPSPSYDTRRRNLPSSSSCWGSEVSGYCSGSYGTGNSKSEAESKCMDTADCGGIYEPGGEPGQWYLCKDFDLYTSNSDSHSIRKECDTSPSPSPSRDSPSYDDDRRRRTRSDDDRRRRARSSSCWGREQDGYCSGSYDGHSRRSEAESACNADAGCGGIYQPGNEPGQWYLCKGFDVYASTSSSKSIKKECGSSSSPSPPTDYNSRRREQDYQRRRDRSCYPCIYWDCLSNQCASQNPFMCTGGSAKGGCNSGSSHWGSTSACTACCDTSYC